MLDIEASESLDGDEIKEPILTERSSSILDALLGLAACSTRVL